MALKRALYVVKVGSSTIFDKNTNIFREVRQLVESNKRILMVAGGAEGISRYYQNIKRPISELTLKRGDKVRYCSPDEMQFIKKSYLEVTLPYLESRLREHEISSFISTADNYGLVQGKRGKPMKVVEGGRSKIVKDHMIGDVAAIDRSKLISLLDHYDVVAVSPPIGIEGGEGILNLDADMLAARLSNELCADHLRFITSTPGILMDIKNKMSTIEAIYPNEDLSYVSGRMKQKVKAAGQALKGSADISIANKISATETTLDSEQATWFWRTPRSEPDIEILTRSIEICSVSTDEKELAKFLVRKSRKHGLDSFIDAAGNFVATKGDFENPSHKRVLMLGHMDTVPFPWPVRCEEGSISGRGAVDAKSSLINFLNALISVRLPEKTALRVVGATEEEVSSSKGAFYVRDNYPADAVIIGEPSGVDALTVGYFGLYKLKIQVSQEHAHSAGAQMSSSPDTLMSTVQKIRELMTAIDPQGLSALIETSSWTDQEKATAKAS